MLYFARSPSYRLHSPEQLQGARTPDLPDLHQRLHLRQPRLLHRDRGGVRVHLNPHGLLLGGDHYDNNRVWGHLPSHRSVGHREKKVLTKKTIATNIKTESGFVKRLKRVFRI